MTTKQYVDSPINEALCDFQFFPPREWDMTIPGLIYEKVRGNFPKKKQQYGLGIQFKPMQNGIEQKVENAPPKMQFFSEDNRRAIQVGKENLTINCFKPYESWHSFEPVITNNFEVYKEVAEPKGLKRIGLRYINQINTGSNLVKLEEYFRFYPYVPNDLPQEHGNFLTRIEMPFSHNRDIMILAMGSALSPDGKVSIILDIDYIMEKEQGIKLDETKKWLENAHTEIENVFEKCITEKCRDLFGGLKA